MSGSPSAVDSSAAAHWPIDGLSALVSWGSLSRRRRAPRSLAISEALGVPPAVALVPLSAPAIFAKAAATISKSGRIAGGVLAANWQLGHTALSCWMSLLPPVRAETERGLQAWQAGSKLRRAREGAEARGCRRRWCQSVLRVSSVAGAALVAVGSVVAAADVPTVDAAGCAGRTLLAASSATGRHDGRRARAGGHADKTCGFPTHTATSSVLSYLTPGLSPHDRPLRDSSGSRGKPTRQGRDRSLPVARRAPPPARSASRDDVPPRVGAARACSRSRAVQSSNGGTAPRRRRYGPRRATASDGARQARGGELARTPLRCPARVSVARSPACVRAWSRDGLEARDRVAGCSPGARRPSCGVLACRVVGDEVDLEALGAEEPRELGGLRGRVVDAREHHVLDVDPLPVAQSTWRAHWASTCSSP